MPRKALVSLMEAMGQTMCRRSMSVPVVLKQDKLVDEMDGSFERRKR